MPSEESDQPTAIGSMLVEALPLSEGCGSNEEPRKPANPTPPRNQQSSRPCASPTICEAKFQLEAREMRKKMDLLEDKLEWMLF